jgi:hypothetical protein
MQNIIDTLVEVKLLHEETLTRIGIASPKEKRLYQSCHILHKRGKYYIVHFKELFALDGKMSNFSDEDKSRRDKIAKLLQDWELLEIVNKDNMDEELISINQIKIISHKEKNEWDLVAKYNIGKKKTS